MKTFYWILVMSATLALPSRGATQSLTTGKDRVYNRVNYHVIDTGSIVLYDHYDRVPLPKGYKRDMAFYFSVGENGALQLLTLQNLKSAFPDNHRFHYLLDAQFRSDDELTAWDAYLKTYKIQYLYQQSLK